MAKTEAGQIDGTPEKRLFWSIISDYDAKTAICELIDNAIDTSVSSGNPSALKVSMTLDPERQLISISDNAGGVRRDNLRLLVSPGGSNNNPDSETIGIFGVGSKRAVVALAETIAIKTRHIAEKTLQIDIDEHWLSSPEWEIPYYEIEEIPESTTLIDLTRLRKVLSQEMVDSIFEHLGETYARFIDQGCQLSVNSIPVISSSFDNWSFPPDNEPVSISFDVPIKNEGTVKATVTSGLISDRVPDAENYGCYFYCNNRLIAKEVKNRDVGYFVSGEAGVPHPDASLCRVVVSFSGPAKLMPWNSSKTGINFNHVLFVQVRPTILRLVTHFSSLSRRLKNDWQHEVFQYAEGDVTTMNLKGPLEIKSVALPPLPKVNKSRTDHLKLSNEKIITDKPWTLGLLEAVSAVDVIERQRWDTGSRISLILLDSNFEIALKEFIVHRQDLFPKHIYTDAKIKEIFERRYKVINEVMAKHPIDQALLDRANHYYEIRNKLIHERASTAVTKADVDNYRKAIQSILTSLFGLSFAA